MEGVERVVNEEIDNVTQKDWKSYVHHAKKLQEEGFMKEIGQDFLFSFKTQMSCNSMK